MIWLEVTENGDVGRFVEVPKLKTGELVDNDGGWFKIVENVEGGRTDVADKMGVFVMGV